MESNHFETVVGRPGMWAALADEIKPGAEERLLIIPKSRIAREWMRVVEEWYEHYGVHHATVRRAMAKLTESLPNLTYVLDDEVDSIFAIRIKPVLHDDAGVRFVYWLDSMLEQIWYPALQNLKRMQNN